MVNLKKLLIAAFICLTPSVSFSKTIELITRFGPSATSGQFAIEFVNALNSMQSEYEFRVVVVPGAAGEAADMRTINTAREGKDVLLWGSSSSFTFNKIIVGNTYDRDKDLVPLQSVAGIPFSIQVRPDSDIKTFVDLLNHIKGKPKAFNGNTVSSSATQLLNAIFKHNFNITNVQDLSYSRPYDITRGVLVNEADYTIFNHSDVIGLRILVVSSENRLPSMLDVPTGKEVGMPDFKFNSLSMISVPKERLEFGRKIQPLLAKICDSEYMKERVSKTGYFPNCLGVEGIKSKIKEEIVLIDKYKHLVNFK